MSEDKAATCVLRKRGPDLVPLLRLEYRRAPLWIFPEHLPIRIHDSGRLVGKVVGAEAPRPAEHRH